jgi:hypothetical protein
MQYDVTITEILNNLAIAEVTRVGALEFTYGVAIFKDAVIILLDGIPCVSAIAT